MEPFCNQLKLCQNFQNLITAGKRMKFRKKVQIIFSTTPSCVAALPWEFGNTNLLKLQKIQSRVVDFYRILA